jgi:hypothetical protein
LRLAEEGADCHVNLGELLFAKRIICRESHDGIPASAKNARANSSVVGVAESEKVISEAWSFCALAQRRPGEIEAWACLTEGAEQTTAGSREVFARVPIVFTDDQSGVLALKVAGGLAALREFPTGISKAEMNLTKRLSSES